MRDGTTAYLELADWRRRIARLYAEVRSLAVSDPEAALTLWRTMRERLYREHSQSPLPAEQRAAFRACHFPYDPAMRFEARVTPAEAGDTAPEAAGSALPMSSAASPMTARRIGWIAIPFSAGERRLALLWIEGYGNGLFLPFRDATSGTETYGAGRYAIDAVKSADLGGDPARQTIVVDFNFAYHPSCAFDPQWACPLAPRENWLDIPIRAGERLA